MSSEIISNNKDDKLWQFFVALLPTALQIVWEGCKNYKEKKKLVKILKNTRKKVKNACKKLGIKKLTTLPILPENKSLDDLINFYHENKECSTDLQVQLKTVSQVKKELEKKQIENTLLMTELQQTEEKLVKETPKKIDAEIKRENQVYFNEFSWKKLEEEVIEYRIEQWINGQLEEKKIQETLDITDLDYRDYGIWDQY